MNKKLLHTILYLTPLFVYNSTFSMEVPQRKLVPAITSVSFLSKNEGELSKKVVIINESFVPDDLFSLKAKESHAKQMQYIIEQLLNKKEPTYFYIGLNKEMQQNYKQHKAKYLNILRRCSLGVPKADALEKNMENGTIRYHLFIPPIEKT